MSRKQIIIWFVIGIIILLMLFPPKVVRHPDYYNAAMPHKAWMFDRYYWGATKSSVDWDKTFLYFLALILLSGFLIYCLWDKKKEEGDE